MDQAALVFGSGRTVAALVVNGEDTLEVHGPSGRVELTVRLLDTGPVLSFESAAVQIKSPGAVAIDCDRFDVRARGGIKLDTDVAPVDANPCVALRCVCSRAQEEPFA